MPNEELNSMLDELFAEPEPPKQKVKKKIELNKHEELPDEGKVFCVIVGGGKTFISAAQYEKHKEVIEAAEEGWPIMFSKNGGLSWHPANPPGWKEDVLYRVSPTARKKTYAVLGQAIKDKHTGVYGTWHSPSGPLVMKEFAQNGYVYKVTGIVEMEVTYKGELMSAQKYGA